MTIPTSLRTKGTQRKLAALASNGWRLLDEEKPLGPIVREIISEDGRYTAARWAEVSGYPRKVSFLEIQASRWWELHDGVGSNIDTTRAVAWLIWGVADGELHMHGIAHRGSQVITGNLTPVILEAARSMGAERVTQPLMWDEHTPPREVRKMRALRRLWVRAGWKQDEFGMPYMEVG